MARLGYGFYLDMTRDVLDFSSIRNVNRWVTDSPFQGEDSFSQETRSWISSINNFAVNNAALSSYNMTGEFRFDQGKIVDGLVRSISYNTTFGNPPGQTYPNIIMLSDVYKPYFDGLTSGVIGPEIFEWALGGDDIIDSGFPYGYQFSEGLSGDKLFAFAGNDRIFAATGNDYIDGGSGIDTSSYIGKISEYTINRGDGFISIGDLIPNRDGLDTLVNIERLQFVDYTLDVSRTSPIDKSIYLLYKAAFGRVPDLGGFDYWTSAAATKGFTISDLAGFFSTSTEFKNLFGENPTNEQYINKLYQNVLDRVPDITGSAFWTDQLSKGVTKETVLVGFALSDENLKMTEAYTKDGYWLS